MQAEQRAPRDKERFKPRRNLWHPYALVATEGEPVERTVRVTGKTRYVVVEDILDGTVVLEASLWPNIDNDGRLVFSGEPETVVMALDEAQLIINDERIRRRAAGGERSLRVGDVFAVSRIDKGLEGASIWDISSSARDAAKAALYGAVASTVDEEYAETFGMVGDLDDVELKSGEFDVAQRRHRAKGEKRR